EDQTGLTTKLEHSVALTPTGDRRRLLATTPASDSFRTATNCSSSAKQVIYARPPGMRTKHGCTAVTCTTRLPTAIGRRADASLVTTGATFSWIISCEGRTRNIRIGDCTPADRG